jgi:uncharacterized protein (TIGR00299 family) protein
MKALYLDCFSGISGDMTVGALLDAGADFALLRDGLMSLGVPGFHVEAEKVAKRGVAATQFRVVIDPDTPKPHRHLHHIEDIITGAALPEAVRAGALKTFRLLGDAEAAVHGIPVQKVHFHEVGAIDSIVDIIGANLALHLLGIEAVFASPVHVGGGTIHCDHGVMPVPAPATAMLLRGCPMVGDDLNAELATPTGAALAVSWTADFGPMPAMTATAVGHGAGGRDLPDRANVLRVIVGEMAALPTEPAGRVTVIEALIDDMSGELLAPALDALLAAGAHDAFLTPVMAKKGRPAHLLTVLCDGSLLSGMTRTLFEHTTTLGLRFREERRTVLERAWRSVPTAYGAVRVKMGFLDGVPTVFHPEYEDCRARAAEQGVPVRRVAEAAHAAAVEGRWCDA